MGLRTMPRRWTGVIPLLTAFAWLLPACSGPSPVEAQRKQKEVLDLGKVTRKRHSPR